MIASHFSLLQTSVKGWFHLFEEASEPVQEAEGQSGQYLRRRYEIHSFMIVGAGVQEMRTIKYLAEATDVLNLVI